MKKNSRLICLLVAVLLATTMLSSVAFAKDEQTALKGNLYVMPLEDDYTNLNSVFKAQNGLTFTVDLYQDNKQLGLEEYKKNDYYADQIALEWFKEADKYIASTTELDENVKKIDYFLTKTENGQPVILEPEYLTITSSNTKVIAVSPAPTTENPVDKTDKTKYYTGAEANSAVLKYMTTDNMIDYLYNNAALDLSKGMIPGESKITIKAFAKGKDANGKDALLEVASRTFTIKVNVVEWQKIKFFPNAKDYLKDYPEAKKDFPYDTPFVTEKNGEYYIYLNELKEIAKYHKWMTIDKGYTFPMHQLGDFNVDPDLATYQEAWYDIPTPEDRTIANVHNDTKKIVIKTAGDFNLEITDKSGYSDTKLLVKFHVLDAREAEDEITKVRFETYNYIREPGDIIDLDTFAYLTRKVKDKETESPLYIKPGCVYIWDEDTITKGPRAGQKERSGINSTAERFTVEWTSSDPSVAKVFNKKDIYQTLGGSSNPWTYWDPEMDEVEDMVTGASHKRLVVWSNEDEVWTFVHEGTVLALKAGDATITLKITNQGTGKTVTDKVKIHVNGEIPTEPVLSGLSVPEEMKFYSNSGMSDYINAIVSPADVDAKISYVSTNDAIAIVDAKGKVTPGKDGECDIIVTATDGKKTLQGTVKVTVIGNAAPVVVVEKNGLTRDTDNKYRYYEKNVLKDITGIVWFDGAEFWVINGELAQDATGLTYCPDKKFYFLESGRILRVTQGASYDDEYFFVSNGELDTKKNGLCDYDGAKFLIAEGHFIKHNGLWLNPADGKWYYLIDGQVSNYSGVAEYDHRFFVVKDGILDTSFNDTVEYDGHTFVVRNGQLEVSPLK